MDNKEIKKLLKDIDNSIERIDKKQNKLMFFVADSKGTPIGSLSYIYDLAYKLQEMGYNVQMLYAEKDFTGVASWMGEKYANLPHYNVGKDIVDVNPSDVVFIPELYSSVMTKTKELKCKKVAILTNFDYMTDLIPYGATWMSMGIYDCITTTNALKERLNEVFPQVRTRVIRPVIAPLFQPKTGHGRYIPPARLFRFLRRDVLKKGSPILRAVLSTTSSPPTSAAWRIPSMHSTP